jgi:hypothetical protein
MSPKTPKTSLALLLLAACGAGLDPRGQPVAVVLHVVDGAAPKAGLTVLALDESSNRLGSAVTDADGVARISVSQPGAMWLAANAGNGRGVVTRVTAQNDGTTDVGVRGVALLDEQPAVFALKGLGYEERLTSFDQGVIESFVVLEDTGSVLVARYVQDLATNSQDVAVEIDPDGAEHPVADAGPNSGFTSLSVDGRFAEIEMESSADDGSRMNRVVIWDSLLHAVVYDQTATSSRQPWFDNFNGTRASSFTAGGRLNVVVAPQLQSDGSTSGLAIDRLDLASGALSRVMLWPDAQPGGWVGSNQTEFFASFPTSATNDDQAMIVFDAATLIPLGAPQGMFAPNAFAAAPSGPDTYSYELDTTDTDTTLGRIFDEDGATGTRSIVGQTRCPCDTCTVSSDREGSTLAILMSATEGCTADGPIQPLLLLAGDVNGLSSIPLDGLPGSLGGFYLSPGGGPTFWAVDRQASGEVLSVWRLVGGHFSSTWQGAPSESPRAGRSWTQPSGPAVLWSRLAGSDAEQITVDGGSGLRTWARNQRSDAWANRDGSRLWYLMDDPLSSRRQLFTLAAVQEVAP